MRIGITPEYKVSLIDHGFAEHFKKPKNLHGKTIIQFEFQRGINSVRSDGQYLKPTQRDPQEWDQQLQAAYMKELNLLPGHSIRDSADQVWSQPLKRSATK
jgi:hypothetical protein